MSAPVLISALADVAEAYDAVLCDVWGVIHNGVESFPDAAAALAGFRASGKPVVLISNAPRPSRDVVPQLHALLVPDEAWSGFVTSGDVTRAEIARRTPGLVWAIGPERDRVLFRGLDLGFAGPEDAAFITCTGLYDDERETAEDYRPTLSVAAARGIGMICANPDRVVQRGDRLIPCAGALADLYESLGGPVIMAGKPKPPIYAMALAEAERLAGRALDRRRVLAIGDGMPTDVAGANAKGLDLLFIAAGIHAAEALDADGALDPARLDAFLKGAGAQARYAMRALA